MKKIFLFLSLLFCFQLSLSQETSSAVSRPKIGLVLSGGGAKGLAHIGVLKVIDSLGIKIDYIGGTSMGAIVGGLYASGYTGKQLDSIFSTVDADALIQDFTPRDSKNFYQKRNDEIYALTLPFDNFKIGFPSALSKGLYNYNMLSRLTMHVSDVKDFDELPIPFFCIATNIENGEEVVLDKGILPQAMIASGAVPSLYNPMEIDGKILIDGGVINNYPVELVRGKGADIIIGVDVQDGFKNRENLKGATELLSQVANFAMIEKMKEKRKLTDIYIKPNIKGYNMVSFEKGEEIIPKGVEAADKHLSELSALSVADYSREPMKKFPDSLYVKEIKVNPLKDYTRSYVIGKLRIKPGNVISLKKFEKGINNLNATQNFSSIAYSFQNDEVGSNTIVLDMKEKESHMFFKLGLHYDDLFKSGLLLNLTKKKLFRQNDVFSFDVVLGDNFRYNLNYYIDNGFYWSFGFNSRLVSFNKNIRNDFKKGLSLTNLGVSSINVDFLDLSNQIYLQTIFAQKFSIGAGFEHKYLKLNSGTIQNTTPVFERSNYLSTYGYMKFDSFDKKYFPSKGVYFSGEIKSFLYSTDYTNEFNRFSIAKADMGIVHTFFKRLALKLQTEGGFAVGENSVNFFDFALGGYGYTQVNNFRPFYGYDFVSIAGNSYVKGLIELDWEFYKKNHFNISGNFSNIDDDIFDTAEGWLSKPTYTGYALGYGLETIIGPIEVKYSWSPETHNQYTWVALGFWF